MTVGLRLLYKTGSLPITHRLKPLVMAPKPRWGAKILCELRIWDVRWGVFSRSQVFISCSNCLVLFAVYRHFPPNIVSTFQAVNPSYCSRSSTHFRKALAEMRTARPIRIAGSSPFEIIS